MTSYVVVKFAILNQPSWTFVFGDFSVMNHYKLASLIKKCRLSVEANEKSSIPND